MAHRSPEKPRSHDAGPVPCGRDIRGPADRSGSGGARRCAAAPLAVLMTCLGLGGCMDVSAETPAPPKKDDSIQVTADQLRQLSVVKVEMRAFRLEKSAVGQIAYNEDAST